LEGEQKMPPLQHELATAIQRWPPLLQPAVWGLLERCLSRLLHENGEAIRGTKAQEICLSGAINL